MRRWVPVLLVAAVELALYQRYAALGAQFHFWLHALVGAAIGFALLGVVALVAVRPAPGATAAGFAGHAYSAFPDVLFLPFGVVHAFWMDVFALHIAVHFVPAPLVTAFAVFAVSLCAWAAARLGRRRLSACLLALALAVSTGALLARRPVPRTLVQVVEQADGALLCPVPGTVRSERG